MAQWEWKMITKTNSTEKWEDRSTVVITYQERLLVIGNIWSDETKLVIWNSVNICRQHQQIKYIVQIPSILAKNKFFFLSLCFFFFLHIKLSMRSNGHCPNLISWFSQGTKLHSVDVPMMYQFQVFSLHHSHLPFILPKSWHY